MGGGKPSSVSEFSKLKDEIQSILDGECDAGNLAQMHNKVALLSAQNTLNTEGQDEDVTAIVNFIGHAAYIWKLFPSSDWKIQLHAALMVLEKIDQRKRSSAGGMVGVGA